MAHTASNGERNMAHMRKNVWELGGDWADPILWYARGVKAMKARALNEPTGWRFYGAIHGFYQPVAATRVCESRGPDAEQEGYRDLLAAVPARQLVLPALAPRLSDRLRSRRSRSRRKSSTAPPIGRFPTGTTSSRTRRCPLRSPLRTGLTGTATIRFTFPSAMVRTMTATSVVPGESRSTCARSRIPL